MKNLKLLLAVIAFLPSNAFPQTVSTIAEGEPDDGMVLDSNGNLFAASYDTGKVFAYGPDGTIFPFTVINSGIVNANGMAFDSSGYLYVADPGSQKIRKYDGSGTLYQEFASTGNPAGMIKAFDNNGIIFSSYVGNKISRLDNSGNITVISADPLLVGPVGLAYDATGNLFVGNFDDRKIYKVLPNGNLVYIAQVPSAGSLPNLGYITYFQGKIWATTMTGHKIYYVNPDAIDDITLFAGSNSGNTDGDISVAKFRTPNGIIPNQTNDGLYITEYASKNIRLISNITLAVKAHNSISNLIKVYPNPSKDYIKFEINDTFEKSEVYDTNGKLLIQSLENYISTKELTAGLYFLKTYINNTLVTSKFIKT